MPVKRRSNNNKLKLNRKQAINLLSNINERLNNLEKFQQEPEDFIRDYFDKIAAKINGHKEKLVEQINANCDSELAKLENLKQERLKNLKERLSQAGDFDFSQFKSNILKTNEDELRNQETELNDQETNGQRVIDIKNGLLNIRLSLNQREAVLLNKTRVRFDAKDDSVSSFGRLTVSYGVDYDDGFYVGEMSENNPCGKGKRVWTSGLKNGEKYVGEFGKGGHFHGKGTLYSNKDKCLLRGDWTEGNLVKGEWFCAKGDYRNHKYEGTFSNLQFNGHGTYFFPNGDAFEGKWRNGMEHGMGQFRTRDGILEQKFKNGKLISSKWLMTKNLK